MIKSSVLILLLSVLTQTQMNAQSKSFHDFVLTTIDGAPFDFAQLRGKKVLLVNVASQCGYTPQYEDLQALHEQYSSKVVIIGVPSNNFGGQEPGTNLDIAAFCKKNYGVSFLMLSKIDVIGKNAHPLYEWLAQTSGATPKWNFSKYLIDGSGKVLGHFASSVNPFDSAIIDKL